MSRQARAAVRAAAVAVLGSLPAVMPADLAQAAVHTWTGPGGTTLAGTTGNWNDPGNWAGGLPAPGNTTQLDFNGNGAAGYTATNDLGAPFDVNLIKIGGSGPGVVVIDGAPLRLVGNGPLAPAAIWPFAFSVTTPVTFNTDMILTDQTYLTGSGSGPITINGVISGPGSLFKVQNARYTLTQPNTFAGGTIIDSGTLTLAGAGTLGSGAVTMRNQGRLLLPSAANIASGDGSVRVGSGAYVQFDTLDQAAINRLAPGSDGMIGIASNTTANLDLSGTALRLGGNFVGSTSSNPNITTFSGSITPGIGDVYRLGGQINGQFSGPYQSAVLQVNSALIDGPFAAPRSVSVGGNGFTSGGRVKIANTANSYTGGTVIERRNGLNATTLYFDFQPTVGQTPLGTGPLVVNDALMFSGVFGAWGAMPNAVEFRPGSQLILDHLTFAGIDRWPDAKPIGMVNTVFTQRGNSGSTITERVGAVSVENANRILLDRQGSTRNNVLQIAALTRVNRGVLELQSTQSNLLGAGNNFRIDNLTGVIDPGTGMLAPWIVGNRGGSGDNRAGDYLSFDPAGVLQVYNYATAVNPAVDDEVVTTNSIPGDETVWAFRAGGTVSINPGSTLTIRSGGLLFGAATTINGTGSTIAFDNYGTPTEGILYASGADATVNVRLTGTGGLTKFGSRTVTLGAENDFSGGLLVHHGIIRLGHPQALAPANDNPVTLNEHGILDLNGHSVTLEQIAGRGQVTNRISGTVAPSVLTINATAPVTFDGQISDGGSNNLGLTKTGASLLTLGGTMRHTGPLTLSQGALYLNGSSSVTVVQTVFPDAISAAGTIMGVNGDYHFGNVDGVSSGNGGRIDVAGSLTANRVRLTKELNVADGGKVTLRPNGTDAATSNTGLSIAGSGQMDLADNRLVTFASLHGSWNGSAYTGVSGMIASGRNGGEAARWSGPGLVTSMVDASSGLASIGIARASEVLGIANSQTATWSGERVFGTATLVMYTFAGDANLDGKINIDDYGRIDSNVGVPGANGWFNGDFNYDGKINIDDYGIIDSNISQQDLTVTAGGAPDSAGVTAVPEPAALALLALAPAMLPRRRRR